MKTTKSEQSKRLLANAIERTRWLGAIDHEDRLSLATKYGPLHIRYEIDGLKNGRDATISAFCRFYDPAALAAHGIKEGNHYSGKWNWHFLDKDGVNYFLHLLENLEGVTQ